MKVVLSRPHYEPHCEVHSFAAQELLVSGSKFSQRVFATNQRPLRGCYFFLPRERKADPHPNVDAAWRPTWQRCARR